MSALRILAAAYRDGWAFVQEDDRVVLVRPPYQRSKLVVVSPDTVEHAVQKHGFESQAMEVEDWRALVDLLRGKRAALGVSEGAASLEDHERMARLVRTAPRAILERYLDRVEHELIPREELDAAVRVLEVMRRSDNPNLDAVLRERLADLAITCSAAIVHEREEKEGLLDREQDLGESFPGVAKTHGAAATAYARQVRERGYILAVGSRRR